MEVRRAVLEVSILLSTAWTLERMGCRAWRAAVRESRREDISRSAASD